MSLAEDAGAIGQILRGFSNAVFRRNGWELLREAARRELDRGDPWEFLLGVRGIASQDARVFRAAQSQRIGWRRLLDKAHGWGKLREECEQLVNTPPGTPIQPCQRKLFARMWRVKRWVLEDDPKLDPEMRAELERMGKEEDRKLAKRFGRSALEQRAARGGLEADRLDYMLNRYWVRFGNGGPGFMFFSSSAVTHCLHELLCWQGHWMGHVTRVTKRRQRFGLLLADEDNPFIERIEFNHSLSTIKGTGRRAFTFTGVVRGFGTQLFPRNKT